MRRASLLSLTALSLILVACSTVGPEPSSVADLVSSGAPEPIEGYDWFLSADEGEAKLAYGVESSDDLKLGLECTRGTGQLSLTASVDDGATPEIHIESGGDTERYPARAEPAVVHDGLVLTASAPTTAPVFQRFRRVHWLALWQGDDRQTYVPHAESTGRIEQFFAFCG